MSTDIAVREAIREFNGDFTMRAWVAVFVGIVTSAALFLLLVLVFFGIVMTRHWLLWATGVFALFTLAGAWSARRGGDPASTVTVFTDHEAVQRAIAWQVTGYAFPMFSSAAGVSALAMHGPYCVYEAVSMFRSRMPSDPESVRAASRLLGRLDNEQPVAVEKADPPRAAMMLVCLGLAKPNRTVPNPPSIVITEKGREALHFVGKVSA